MQNRPHHKNVILEEAKKTSILVTLRAKLNVNEVALPHLCGLSRFIDGTGHTKMDVASFAANIRILQVK